MATRFLILHRPSPLAVLHPACGNPHIAFMKLQALGQKDQKLLGWITPGLAHHELVLAAMKERLTPVLADAHEFAHHDQHEEIENGSNHTAKSGDDKEVLAAG